ncbi:MAG TPA: FGGY family carbohydrate kinase [Solirubrobacteraceae bacterium]|nr:FGGY family carbohydrate kinase [Solirubrobacteraceae bacterium]
MTIGQPLLVGIDVGTTRVKAGLIGLDGRELGHAAVPTVWQRRPTGAEARPGDFVAAVHDALGVLLASAPPGDIVGVGITSMAETAVLVGADGRALGPAVAWYDRRADADVAEMEAQFTREQLDHRAGLGVGPTPTVAMLRWLVRAHPEARGAVNSLSVAEFVVHGLGGVVAAEPSLASRTGALDINERRWWPEVIEWAGLPESLFPHLLAAGADWGRARSARPGLERINGSVLTVAGHDHLAAAVGSGVTSASQVMDSCGTAEALVRAIPADAARDPAQGLPRGIATGWHVLPDHYCLLSGLPLGIELTPLLDRLDASHKGGRVSLDDDAMAALEERRAGEETPAAAREWLAALEATVARASASLHALEDLGGPIEEVRISGGWAANPVLRRLKLAAFQNTVHPRVSEAGARGAALLAGKAAGVFESIDAFPAPPSTSVVARPLSLSNQPNESLLP